MNIERKSLILKEFRIWIRPDRDVNLLEILIRTRTMLKYGSGLDPNTPGSGFGSASPCHSMPSSVTFCA